MASPRVLKAHRDAVLAAFPGAADALRAGERDEAADLLARAVLHAEDGTRTQYVLVVRGAAGFDRPLILGPYRTAGAAEKAWSSGIGLSGEAGVFELIPTDSMPQPKPKRPSRAKAKADDESL